MTMLCKTSLYTYKSYQGSFQVYKIPLHLHHLHNLHHHLMELGLYIHVSLPCLMCHNHIHPMETMCPNCHQLEITIIIDIHFLIWIITVVMVQYTYQAHLPDHDNVIKHIKMEEEKEGEEIKSPKSVAINVGKL